MKPYDPISHALSINRRSFLTKSAYGLGGAAFAMLAAKASAAGAPPASGFSKGFLRSPHFPVKAKRVIFLCMAGGPPHLELFDNKSVLKKLDGQPFPESFTKGQQIAQLQNTVLKARGGSFEFKKWGKSGMEMTDIFPHIGSVADEIALIRSVHTDPINHDPAVTFFGTGNQQPGRPTMGAWLAYGLGSENANLPSYVVLVSGGGGQSLQARYWGNGFLPGNFQGVQMRSQGDPVLYVSNPPGVSADSRRALLDAMQDLNRRQLGQLGDPSIATHIDNYELAFRMQTSVPELMDISKESKEVLESYGAEPGKASYANNCLLARRLAERGVRFIQLCHRDWDHHGGLPDGIKAQTKNTDRASGALVRDLKQRGMLDETLVIWGGEFGRTAYSQGDISKNNFGRDHHPRCYSLWAAGGGFKPGLVYGRTDEFGYNIVENPVSVHDFHATMLHTLGIDHLKLTYRFEGRDYRLTDVSGELIPGLLA